MGLLSVLAQLETRVPDAVRVWQRSSKRAVLAREHVALAAQLADLALLLARQPLVPARCRPLARIWALV